MKTPRGLSAMTAKQSRTHLRGFASMTPERRKEIAAMGGAATPNEKRGFSASRDLAQSAGRKGGLVKKNRLTPDEKPLP